MNWKFNYWTILFAVALIGWLLTSVLSKNDQADTLAGTEVVPESPYKLKPAEARQRIKKYNHFYDGIEKLLKDTTSKSNRLKGLVHSNNMEAASARFFQIPLGELHQMLSQYKGHAEMVYAELSLEKDITKQGKGRDVIDLIFSVSPVFEENGEMVEDDAFFDFTTPCPPTCQPPPPSDE